MNLHTFRSSLLRSVERHDAKQLFLNATASDPALSEFGSVTDVLECLAQRDPASAEARSRVVAAVARHYRAERGGTWSTLLTAAFLPFIGRLSAWVAWTGYTDEFGATPIVVEQLLETALDDSIDEQSVRLLSSRTENAVRAKVTRWNRGLDAPGHYPFDGASTVSDELNPEEQLQAARFDEAIKRAMPVVVDIAARQPSNDVGMLLDSYSNDDNMREWISENGASAAPGARKRDYQRTRRRRARLAERVRDIATKRGIRFSELEAGPRIVPVATEALN